MQYIFVHGLGQTPSSWGKVIEHMTIATTYCCPDLVAMLKNKEVNYVNLYQAFAAYCDTMSEPIALCGLSLGGVLALQYAIENPSKIKSLVLIGTQYKMPKIMLKLQNVIFRFMPERSFAQMGFGKRAFIDLCSDMAELDFSKDLKKIACPTLVLCGEKDSANKKASEELAKMISGAELQVVEGAGHEVNIESPERLAERLISFW